MIQMSAGIMSCRLRASAVIRSLCVRDMEPILRNSHTDVVSNALASGNYKTYFIPQYLLNALTGV